MTGVLKSLRDYHKQEPKKKKAPVEAKKATPVASKPSPAPSTPSKPKATSGASTAPKKASAKTKVVGPPDRPVSPNRKSSRGSIRVGPASGGPLKSSGTIEGKDVTSEYSKTGLGRVVKKSKTPRPKKYKLK